MADHNFDFNRTFYEGIYYLSKQDEKILRETKKLDEMMKSLRTRDKAVSFEMKAFFNQLRERLRQFFESED